MQRQKGPLWTEDEDVLLKNLLSQVPQRTTQEIAHILGRTRSAIYTRACVKGYTRKKGESRLVLCDFCGNPIRRYRSWLNGHNFCNKTHWELWLKEHGKERIASTLRRDRIRDAGIKNNRSTGNNEAHRNSVRAAVT